LKFAAAGLRLAKALVAQPDRLLTWNLANVVISKFASFSISSSERTSKSNDT